MIVQDPTIKNPFRNRFMANAFAELVWCWRERKSVLFQKDGSRCMGNGFASMFWKGYDGIPVGGGFGDRGSKEMAAYAYFRAGQLCRKAASKEGRVDPPMPDLFIRRGMKSAHA